MKTTTAITFQGNELEVVGEYSEGMPSGDYDVPDDEPSFEVSQVWYRGTDVTELMFDKIFEIEVLALENLV